MILQFRRNRWSKQNSCTTIQTLQTFHIWVLAPQLESDDPNLACYYDFTQSIQEYTKVFGELGLSWTWQPVTLQNFREVLGNIVASDTKPLVLNLCDGDEVNGAPGV